MKVINHDLNCDLIFYCIHSQCLGYLGCKILADLITVKPTLGSKRNVFYLLVASPTINLLFTRRSCGVNETNLFKLFLIQIFERSLFFSKLFSLFTTEPLRLGGPISIKYFFSLLSEIAMDNDKNCFAICFYILSRKLTLERSISRFLKVLQ